MIDITHKEIEESDTIYIRGIEFQKVKHGKWIKKWHSFFREYLPCCSVCDHLMSLPYNYCPYCGAKMDGKDKENE